MGSQCSVLFFFSLVFRVFFFSFAVWYNLLLAVMWRRVGLCRWTDRSFSRIRFRAHAQHTHRERNERVRQLRKVIAWTGYKTETTNEMRSSPTQWEKHMKPSAYVFFLYILFCSAHDVLSNNVSLSVRFYYHVLLLPRFLFTVLRVALRCLGFKNRSTHGWFVIYHNKWWWALHSFRMCAHFNWYTIYLPYAVWTLNIQY